LTVSSGAEPKGELNLKTDFQGYSVVPEGQRLDGMHGIELKFTSRYTKHIIFDAALQFLFPLIEFSGPLFLWSTEGSGRFQVNSFPSPHLSLYPNRCSSIFSLSLIFAGSYCVAASRQVMHHIYCALRFTRHLPRSILELNFTFK
jgi:hypothetical protein